MSAKKSLHWDAGFESDNYYVSEVRPDGMWLVTDNTNTPNINDAFVIAGIFEPDYVDSVHIEAMIEELLNNCSSLKNKKA